jgi:hypothetical protein
MTLPTNEPAEIHKRVTGSVDATEYARLTNAREVAQGELDDRRNKAWRVFSWSSSILLAATLAVIVLFGRPTARFPLWPYGFVAVVVVGLFSACASLWIDQNQALAESARKIIRDHDRKLGVQTDPEATEIVTGYVRFVMLLAAAAILAIAVTVDY